MNIDEPYVAKRLSVSALRQVTFSAPFSWSPSSSRPRLTEVDPRYANRVSRGMLIWMPLLSRAPDNPQPEKLYASS